MKFKIMTWNVENLFRPGAGGPTDATAFLAKLRTIADGIEQLGPDVVALQEIGDPKAFQDLGVALGGAYPHAVLSKKPDGRGIRVGFLSKLPLDAPQDFVDFAPNPSLALSNPSGQPMPRMRRGALQVHVKVGARSITIITAHFKSKLLSYPKPGGGTAFSTTDEDLRARVAALALAERTAEAVTLRTLANAVIAKNNREALILLGDLNDVPEAATTQILQGPEGSQPGTSAFDRPDQGDDARLFNLANLIPLGRRFSRINNGVPELIDHILVSAELLPLQGKKRVCPTVETHAEVQGGIESVGANPGERKNKAGSDHAAVTAGFELWGT